MIILKEKVRAFLMQRGEETREDRMVRTEGRKHKKEDGMFVFEKVEEVDHLAKRSVIGVDILGRLFFDPPLESFGSCGPFVWMVLVLGPLRPYHWT